MLSFPKYLIRFPHFQMLSFWFFKMSNCKITIFKIQIVGFTKFLKFQSFKFMKLEFSQIQVFKYLGARLFQVFVFWDFEISKHNIFQKKLKIFLYFCEIILQSKVSVDDMTNNPKKHENRWVWVAHLLRQNWNWLVPREAE